MPVTTTFVAEKGKIAKALENASARKAASLNQKAANNARRRLKREIGGIAKDQFEYRFGALVDKLEQTQTWHEFGIKDSLGGRNFLQKFWSTFLNTRSGKNFSFRKGKATGRGRNKMFGYNLSYFSRDLLTQNTWVRETQQFRALKGGMSLSWWDSWVEEMVPTEPDRIEDYVFVYKGIKAVRSRSRTGQGIMVHRNRIKNMKGKQRAKLPADVFKQVSEGQWRFRIRKDQRKSIEKVLSGERFLRKVNRIISEEYRKVFERA